MPIKLIRQDITKIKCDAIVNPTDPYFSHGGGVDAAIHRIAGKELYLACWKQTPRLSVAHAILTPAFALPCKYVIHTVGPHWRGGNCGEEALLRSCYTESLKLAVEKNCKSIAFPLISSGTFSFPKESVLHIALETVSSFLLTHDLLVYIVVFDKSSYSISQKLFSDVTAYIDDTYVAAQSRPKAFFSACRLPPRVLRDSAAESTSLEEMLRKMDRGFAETLFSYIDQKGITDVDCYKRANVDKKTFSKLKCNKDYRPSKETAVSFAIALHLSLEETDHLLNTAGLSLSDSNKFDIIIKYFLTMGKYQTIHDVNEVLYQFDQKTLGV